MTEPVEEDEMAKHPTAVGIDVGSKTFHVAFDADDRVAEFENSAEGRKKLVSYIKKHTKRAVVVLESTGPYGFDLALELHRQKRIEVRYVNPAAAKAYAKSGLVRAKTDRVDARMLARMAADGRGQVWDPPSDHRIALRAMTRRIRTLTNDRTREKNRLHAVEAVEALPRELVEDIQLSIAALDERIARLKVMAVEHARKDPEVAAAIELLDSIKGIGVATAVELLGELLCMPSDLTARQLVAQAGLDPRAKQSGMKDGRRSISKMGSRYLRGTLHMAAINGVRWCPEIRAFYNVLTEERNKPKLVAYVAVARKLLHTIHGILRSKTAFDAKRFYNPRQKAAAA
jgi:transposase